MYWFSFCFLSTSDKIMPGKSVSKLTYIGSVGMLNLNAIKAAFCLYHYTSVDDCSALVCINVDCAGVDS